MIVTWLLCCWPGMEIVGPSKRTFAGMAIEFVWCAGEALLLLMAYFVRNWRYLEIALSVPSIGLFFYWWSVLNTNALHWFTTTFLQPLPNLVTP